MGDLNGARPVLRFAWQSSRSDTALQSYAELLIKSYSKGVKPGTQEVKEMSQLLSTMEERQQERDGLFDMRLLQADLKASLGMYDAAYQDYLQLLDYPESRSPALIITSSSKPEKQLSRWVLRTSAWHRFRKQF